MAASDILDDMLAGLKTALKGGFEAISNYAETQGGLLAKQAEHIAQSRVSGALSDDSLFQWMLDGLKRDTENMVRAIAMLALITIETAWNAVAHALWGGISKILTAAGLPAVLIPDQPTI
jgi:hypothetical protein